MKKIASLVAASAVILVGCATNSNTASNNMTAKAQPAIQHFSCENGLSVAVKHLGNDQIELTTNDNKKAILSQARSASGELYTAHTGLWGYGGQWHQKGSQAYFEYVGVHGGAAKNTSCTTR
ncbi:MliC family protein [Moraxella haemolytica]|uniref:MliC family protein n=1 Tax=Moraxella TaxID=475 RepID=UPI002543E225|nr:MliC family protein [Moraxella sp. ZY171148]WII94725.1 MliC family protein [Moraxella sp. ZY171148]